MQNRLASYDLSVAEPLAAPPSPAVRKRRCRASMVLANPGPEKVVIRTAEVRDLDGMRTDAGGTFQVRLAGIVQPNTAARLPITFEVPRTAPPGRYRFEVAVGNLTEAMALDVLPRPGVRLSPAFLIVTAPGTSTQLLTVENSGNVEISVAGTIAVPLDDELIVCRSLRGALTLFDETDESDITADRLVARAAHTAHDALAGAVLGMRFTSDLDPIPPGATAHVEVEIETPKSLDPRTRYTGGVPILTATLGIVVASTKVAGVLGVTDASLPSEVGTAKGRRTTKAAPRRRKQS